MLARLLGWRPRPSRATRHHAVNNVDPGNPTSLRWLAGGQSLDWTATQWGLLWLADTYVLGTRGIEPKLPTAEATAEWHRHKVDPDMTLTPRAFQRVILASLLLDGEAFTRREAGHLEPMPLPYRIHEDDRGKVSAYEWRPDKLPPIMLPTEAVIHTFLRVRPWQKRGYALYPLVEDIARERRQFLFGVIKAAKMTSLLRLFHKRRSGNPLMHAEATAEDADSVVEIDWTADGITGIGPNDDIISPQISSGPVPVLDVERAAGGAIGQPFGISRMQATRDYSDTSYSSARFASLMDAATWERYQGELLELTRELYRLWPGRASDDDPEWHLPHFPSIDPTKDAAVDKMYIELGVTSRQEVIRRRGGDPEQVRREIEEWQPTQPQERSAPDAGNTDSDGNDGPPVQRPGG